MNRSTIFAILGVVLFGAIILGSGSFRLSRGETDEFFAQVSSSKTVMGVIFPECVRDVDIVAMRIFANRIVRILSGRGVPSAGVVVQNMFQAAANAASAVCP